MPSPRRRPKLYTAGDLSRGSLADRKWHELVDLAEEGAITWADVNRAVRDRFLASNNGVDPYGHLRPRGADDD